MSDLRISYEEEMVGSGHPTKTDTLNRLFLGGPAPVLRDTDGKVLYNLFKEQAADPSTGIGEGALFAKQNSSGVLALHWRRPGDGEVIQLGQAIEDQQTVSWSSVSWTSDGGGQFHADQSITAVDLSRAVVFLLEHDLNNIISCYFVDDSTVRLRCWSTGAPSAITATAIVVELSSFFTVQHVTFPLTANSGTENSDVTVSDFEAARWFVVPGTRHDCHAANNSSGTWAYWYDYGYSRQDATTLRLTTYRTGTGTGDDTAYAQLISW
jgi:hypothetical protein